MENTRCSSKVFYIFSLTDVYRQYPWQQRSFDALSHTCKLSNVFKQFCFLSFSNNRVQNGWVFPVCRKNRESWGTDHKQAWSSPWSKFNICKQDLGRMQGSVRQSYKARPDLLGSQHLCRHLETKPREWDGWGQALPFAPSCRASTLEDWQVESSKEGELCCSTGQEGGLTIRRLPLLWSSRHSDGIFHVVEL